VLSLQNPSREEKLNYLCVGVSLLLRNGVSIDIERGPAVRMTQKVLRHFDVRPNCPKQDSQGMAEVVPADDLAFDPGAFESRSNAFLQQVVRAERLATALAQRL
jgi:hypothetical protein